jgi:hypothetical protein
MESDGWLGRLRSLEDVHCGIVCRFLELVLSWFYGGSVLESECLALLQIGENSWDGMFCSRFLELVLSWFYGGSVLESECLALLQIGENSWDGLFCSRFEWE